MNAAEQYYATLRADNLKRRDEWMQAVCGDNHQCSGAMTIGYGLISGDLSTERLRQQMEQQATDYLRSKAISYACSYGSVACAGAVTIGAVLEGKISSESAGRLAITSASAAAGTAFGCTLGPLGCVAGNIAGGIVGGIIADSPVGDLVGGVIGGVAGGIKSVGEAIGDVLGL